ncbi:protein translocase subunit SecF, partial [Candidatus Dependentiae bacterium]|nr:protein translocase subunit SecF [Candidatus Dependentiae bacterium]
ESLRGFSFVMMLGIIFGTYSSIYIASPVMIYIEQRAAHKKEVL